MKVKRDKLDDIFSKYIRANAKGFCEYCGKYVGFCRLQTSHFRGRRCKTTRWDENNVSCVCFSCHMYLGENPYAHTEWFKKRLGSVKFEQLNIIANMTTKEYPVDKDKLMQEYKEKMLIIREE